MPRRRFVVQPLEDRLTPSFTISPSMSPDELRQFTETRADMYTVEAARPASPTTKAPALQLRDFTAVQIDHGTLADHLADAPREGAGGPAKVFAVPRPDGSFDRFNVWEVSIMAPELAAQFPDIRTWRGQGIDDPTATLVADLTPLGFHAQVLSSNGRWYVDPYYHQDTSLYAAYAPKDLENGHGPGCGCAGCIAVQGLVPEETPVPAARPTNGQTLRTYRTAVAATGEYTRFFGGSVANGQAAIVTAINRVSGIFESELAIRLELVANNSALVFTNPGSDPYSNNDAYAMLGQNQTKLDAVIGPGNYDLGHVFSTGGGGLAYLRSVGKAAIKAGGVTGSPAPTGDAFWVDYVAHEVGHQFGANHTFNGVTAGPNRHGATAYEPGSGSTIMSYAGIMGSDDIQGHSDPYFHAASLEEISNYIASGPGSGFIKVPTGNTIPTADAGPDWIIPANTPFKLTGAGNDPDGDVLTYTWEQYNLGPAKSLFSDDNSSSPLFRSFAPSTDPTRTFPLLSSILNNNSYSPSNHAPETSRTMKFRLTVRDNGATGGAYSRDDATVRVVNTGKAFAVTFPSELSINLPGGSTQTVTWEVAKTDRGLINTEFVNILLSTDNGQTFTAVAENVPNDGSQDVVLPNLTTTQARIKVEAVGNVFFDISNRSFRITAGPVVTAVASPLPAGKYELGAVIPLTVQYSAPVTVTGVPQLRLNSGGVANYVSGSGTNTLTFSYTVGAGNMAADLDAASTTALELNGGTVTTPGNFPVARTLPVPGTPGSLGAASDIWVDTADTASVVGVSSPAANGTYGAGAVIPISVTFDRAVNVTGIPQLQLNAHARAIANYVSGSGTDTLTFHYVVGPADSTSDLDYAAAAVIVNGSTITSPITGSAAVLALPAPGSPGSLGAANDLSIGNPSVSLTDATYETVEGVGTYTVTVLRIGDPTGAVSVDYAVTAGTAGGDDYTVTSAASPLTWADGDATPRQIVIQINDDALSEGRESLGIALSNLTGPATFGIDEAELLIRQSDGLVPGKFTDEDGDIATISLSPKTGAGSLLVYLTNGAMPVSLLETAGTDSNKSVVTVSVVKAKTSTDNGLFPVGGVVGSGVKTLNLSKSPVTGDGIRLAGMVQSLTVDSLANGADVVTTGPAIPKKKTLVTVKKGVGDGSDFVLNAPVSTFTAGSVGNGRIEAPSIGTLSVKGNFAGDVAVSGVGVAPGLKALGTMRVVGTVDGSAIDVAGIVGSVTVGSFLNSQLFAGYTGDDVGGGTFDPAGVVTSFLTTGRFANSSVIAATVKTVTLASVDGDNGGVDKFGIYADLSIRTVVVKEPRMTFTNPTTLTGFEDFEIEVV
jgi:hypothetical protein